MFVLFCAFFAQYGMLARVLLRKACVDTFHKTCDELDKADMHEASARAALVSSYVLSSSGLLSILSTSWLAAASDVIGRRIVLAGSAAFMFVSSIGTFCVVLLGWSSWTLIPFYAVGGLGGSFTSFNAAAFAFTADVTSEPARPSRFSVLESFIFLGGVAGSTSGAQLLRLSDSAPFAATSALYLAIVFYVPCVMAETVPGASWRRLREVSWWGTLRGLLAILHPCPTPSSTPSPTPSQRDHPPAASAGSIPSHDPQWQHDGHGHGRVHAPAEVPSSQRSRGSPLPWLLVFLAVYCADNEALILLPLLTKLDNSSTIEMDPSELSLLTATGNLCKWSMLCLVSPLAVRLLGPARAPAVAIRAGATVGAAVLLPWGFAQSKPVLFLLVGAQSVTIVTLPAIRSMLSASQPESAQGRVLGAVSIFESLSTLVTPLVGGAWLRRRMGRERGAAHGRKLRRVVMPHLLCPTPVLACGLLLRVLLGGWACLLTSC